MFAYKLLKLIYHHFYHLIHSVIDNFDLSNSILKINIIYTVIKNIDNLSEELFEALIVLKYYLVLY